MRPHRKGRFHPLKDLELERYVCDDLPPAERLRIERLLAGNPDAQAHVAERRASREAFKLRQPPLRLPPERARFAPWALGFGIAGAALALCLLVLLPSSDNPMNEGVQITSRGGVAITVDVLRGDDTFQYREGVLLKGGDRIRLTLASAATGFVSVIGRGADGAPVVHYDNEPVTAGTDTLPDSLELDDAAGPEELLIFHAPQPVPTARLLESIRTGEWTGLSPIRLLLQKEPSL